MESSEQIPLGGKSDMSGGLGQTWKHPFRPYACSFSMTRKVKLKRDVRGGERYQQVFPLKHGTLDI